MLAVDRLGKRFGKKIAVDGVSFSADRGHVLGLLGPNGAGKTTTFLCLAGLMRPDSGTISLDGRDIGDERTRHIALIPETPNVHGLLTVWEHLVFVAKSAKLRPGWEARGTALLERFDMLGERNTLGRELSKGMRQKTLVVATVLAEMPVVLFDEPMIGLDPRGQRELRELIHELRDRGTIVVVSTHLLASAREICNDVLILKAGRTIYGGPLDAFVHERADGRTLEDVFLEATA